MSYARQMLDTFSRTVNVDVDVLAAAIDAMNDCAQACTAEMAFLRDALPDAEVRRVTHMIAGAHVCEYAITPARS